MAIVVIIVLPIACAYPFFQKYFISGLTVGAVKGDCARILITAYQAGFPLIIE